MTANQMKYLLTLLRQKPEKRSVTLVASIYGVHKSTVSRALKGCVDNGLLDEKFQLTSYGNLYVKDYENRYEQICKLLSLMGVSEDQVREDAHIMIESCSAETLQAFCQKGEFCRACESLKKKGRRVFIEGDKLWEYVSEGSYKASFVFFKAQLKEPIQISMANDAFSHPAKLVIKKNNSYLCLKTKDVIQHSPRGKFKIEGKLKSMKYEDYGITKEVIIDSDIVYIPLSVLKFVYLENDNILQGYAKLTMTCTVGIIHMPESQALLKVYL